MEEIYNVSTEALPGQRLVRVAFGGTQTTDKPLVASLAIECGALVSIMAVSYTHLCTTTMPSSAPPGASTAA